MEPGIPQSIIANPRDKHRNFLRFPLALPAKCLFSVDEAAARCRLIDISEQGIGLEIDAPIRIENGQVVLLKIDLDPRLPPVSAITELAWVRRRKNGQEFQRVGSRLRSIDPEVKERLLKRAYAAVISRITGGGSGRKP